MKRTGPIIQNITAPTSIEQVAEIDISKTVHLQIYQLLSKCFSGYPKDKSYFKQLPHFRLLAKNENQLIGHVAVDYRVVNVGDDVFRIFGLADVCVDQAFQSNNVASTILDRLEELGKISDIDFMVLITNQHEFYRKNGFSVVDNLCRWVFINDDHTLGVSQRKLGKSIMVKPLSDKKWGTGTLDFLGHIF